AAVAGPLPAQPRRRWWTGGAFRLLVTCHRRENWGAGLDRLAAALRQLCGRRVQADVILPPNPRVTERLTALLAGASGVRLVPPLSHAATIAAMRVADLVLTDSGGMQEEAPALGVPLLVLRDKTERPEGLATGTTELVGTDAERIIAAVERLRRDRRLLRSMTRPAMPFGDGQASSRIARDCLMFLEEAETVQESRIA
ncbi:MAG TPA: UDP-N-acetylglucosamine 2-epimerase, partial [Sphingomicrobium sp.]